MKIEEAIELFIKYLSNERKYPDTTISSYKQDLEKKYLTFLNKHKDIDYKNITKEQIRILLKEETDYGSKKASISRMLSTLRHFYSYLETHNIITNNSFKTIRNPKREKRRCFLDPRAYP